MSDSQTDPASETTTLMNDTVPPTSPMALPDPEAGDSGKFSPPIPTAVITTSLPDPEETFIDSWFADHFSDQTFSRESDLWSQAYEAKEKLKEILKSSGMPAFPGLIDQWFWDSFSNSNFSHDVTAWNLAYEAKQKLKFLITSR